MPLLFWGAIYVATKKESLETILELAKAKPAERAVDLGSGDGRLLIALAEKGIESHGYGMNHVMKRLEKRWKEKQSQEQG